MTAVTRLSLSYVYAALCVPFAVASFTLLTRLLLSYSISVRYFSASLPSRCSLSAGRRVASQPLVMTLQSRVSVTLAACPLESYSILNFGTVPFQQAFYGSVSSKTKNRTILLFDEDYSCQSMPAIIHGCTQSCFDTVSHTRYNLCQGKASKHHGHNLHFS